MKEEKVFLPSDNYKDEYKILINKGIDSWYLVKLITNNDIFSFTRGTRATSRNLFKLRAIATLICEIKLSQEEAALLIHSGVSSSKSLAALSPQELLQKTGRFERQIKSGRKPIVNLVNACDWIKRAKSLRQIQN